MLEGEVIRVVGKAAVKGAKHWIMRTLSVLAVIGVGWAIYVMAIKPHTKGRLATSTTNQSANKIVNQHLTLERESCWINFLGVKTLCFKNQKVYKLIQKEGEMKLEKK